MKGKNPVTIFIVLIILGVLGMAVVVTADVIRNLRPATETLPADTPTVGIGRDAESADVGIWLASVCADDVPSLAEYTEGDGPAPEWYRPDEEMAVEWIADVTDINVGDINVPCNALQPDTVDYNAPEGIDPGGIDWNVCTTVWGWDGHSMEAWEMDLFSMIFYREFWQPNLTLCEAGCDAILQLWDLNGGTMYETLSHVNEDGSYAFSTFPGVWEAKYDPDGLAWCRAYCEERFYDGPVWPAQYFRKGQYHDWDEWSPIPAYEIDGVYFSTGKGWN